MSPLQASFYTSVSIIGLVIGAPGLAHGYDCAESTPREAFDSVPEVFEARVLSARRSAADRDGTLTLRVLRVFKGTAGAAPRRVVELRWHGADPLPAVGRSFVALAHRSRG